MSAQTTFELAEFLQFSGGSSPPMGASVATALSARTAETDAAADHLLMQPHLNQQQWQPAPLTVDNTRPDAIRVPALASACDVSTVPSATSAPVPPLLAKSPSAIASKPATPLELLFRHQQQQQLQLQAELKRDREKHLLLQQQQQQEQERVRELERERLRQEQMRLSTQSQSYSTDFDGHSWNLFDTVFDDGGASQEAMNMSALEAFAKYGSNSSTGGLPGSSSGGAMSSLLLDPIVTASYLSALHHQSQGTLPINQLATNFSATINPAALMGGGTDSGELLSADFYPDYVVRGGDPLAVLASSSGIGSPTVASASDSAQSLATIRHRPSSAGSRAAPAKRKTVSTHSPKRRQSSAVAVSDSDRAAMLAALRDASGSYFALDSTVQRSADGIAVVPALDHLAESGFPDTSRRVAEPGVALPLQLADGIHGAPSEQSRYGASTCAKLAPLTRTTSRPTLQIRRPALCNRHRRHARVLHATRWAKVVWYRETLLQSAAYGAAPQCRPAREC